MALLKRINILTDGSGDFTYENVFRGVINAVVINVGDLSTPDIAISDGVYEVSVLDLSGVAADARYQPVVAVQDDSGADIADVYGPPAIFGSLKVVVAGGGANKSGSIDLMVTTR
jgi:hypothetical protein